jgi:general secretion pathway protein K
MVLVVVLWTITLLAALAMAASVTFRGFAGIAAVDRSRIQAEALLNAGLEASAELLATSGDRAPDSLETALALSTGTVRAHLSDEGGRIDIGKAPAEVLVSMLRSIGAPNAQSIAQRIMEWRNPDGSARPSAAATAPPQGAKPIAAPFTDVQLLARIQGITKERLATLIPLTTVFGNETVNPMTASREVLAALPGMDPERAAAIIDSRRRFPSDPGRLTGLLGPAQLYLAIKPQRAVSVDLAAKLANGFAATAHAVIVRLPDDNEPYRVLAWAPKVLRN